MLVQQIVFAIDTIENTKALHFCPFVWGTTGKRRMPLAKSSNKESVSISWPHHVDANKTHSIKWNTGHIHDDVIKWKHFPRYWPFVRGIHRSPVNSAHKGQWRGALMFSLICVWINGWVNNCEADDLRRHRAHYDGILMFRLILFLLVYSTFTVLWISSTKRLF